MSMKGKTIAITRPKAQAEKLAEIIIEKGGIPCIVPTVEIVPMKDLSLLKEFSNKGN